MNEPKFIFKLFLCLLVFSAANVFAQSETKPPQAERCYEIVLQVLIASNNPSSSAAVPATLTNAVKKLKTLYAYSDYRVSATFLQRTSNNVEYKSLLNDFNQNSDRAFPVFSDWQLRGLRNLPNAQGRNTLQFEVFHFGARVPVITGIRDDSGKTAAINYESIGITTSKFSLSENEPTIVGSLSTSKPDELMFLVLTVKPVE
jgi:hypothetical protein